MSLGKTLDPKLLTTGLVAGPLGGALGYKRSPFTTCAQNVAQMNEMEIKMGGKKNGSVI